MKKKLCTLLVIAIMGVSLCACGDKKESMSENNATNTGTQEELKYTAEPVVLFDYNGWNFIREELFGTLLDRMELTKENWHEHVKVNHYNIEIEKMLPEGLIVSEGMQDVYLLGPDSEKYYLYKDAILKLKNKETDEEKEIILDWDVSVQEDFKLEDYECIEISGYLYLMDIPEEAIYSPMIALHDSLCGFAVAGERAAAQYQIFKGTKFVSGGGLDLNAYFELD